MPYRLSRRRQSKRALQNLARKLRLLRCPRMPSLSSVTPTKKSKKLEAETTEKKKKMKKRGRASSVPDKPSKPLPEGFSGVTSRSGHCWVCGHEREQHQKGSVCTLCYAHGRKLLKHQRLSELRENPELLERVQQMSAEVREQRQSKKGKTSKREDLMARFRRKP